MSVEIIANQSLTMNGRSYRFIVAVLTTLLAFIIILSGCFPSPAKAEDSGGKQMAPFLNECESPNNQPHCGVTWSFSGDRGILRYGNIVGELLYKWTSPDTIEIDRVDVIPGSLNFTAVYKGHFDGKRFSGTVVWYQPGILPPGGSTGTWQATPAPPPVGFDTTLPQADVPDDEFVRTLFAPYEFPLSEDMASPNPTGDNADKIFEPGLLALIKQDISEAQAGNGIILNMDPICMCQDWDSFQVTSIQVIHIPIIENVIVSFINNGTPQKSVLKLIHTSNGWRIQDIQTDAIPSLRQLLAQGLQKEEVSQFITLSATKSQWSNCNSGSVEGLTTRMLQLDIQNGAASTLGSMAAGLGGSSEWKLLGITSMFALYPNQALEPELVGSGKSEVLTALGPEVLDAGKDENFEGNWMMCEVDFNLQFAHNSPGEPVQTSRGSERSIVLIPSDGPSGLQDMALFGVTQAETQLEIQAMSDDPALSSAVQQGISKGLSQ